MSTSFLALPHPFFLHFGAVAQPLPSPPLALLLDLRLQYLEASLSIGAVCDWVAWCDSFL